MRFRCCRPPCAVAKPNHRARSAAIVLASSHRDHAQYRCRCRAAAIAARTTATTSAHTAQTCLHCRAAAWRCATPHRRTCIDATPAACAHTAHARLNCTSAQRVRLACASMSRAVLLSTVAPKTPTPREAA
eukprot:7382763-Prymnesium_polylepis.3